MVPVGAVADYLILKAQSDGCTVDQLTLQKLVSYAQAFHLAAYGQPLFKNTIEAWDYGPVVRVLRFRFGKYGANPIDVSDAADPVADAHARQWLDEVWQAFGRFSGTELANMWHDEQPYKDAYGRAKPGEKHHEAISPDEMRDYFRQTYEAWEPGYETLLTASYAETATEDHAIAADFFGFACRTLDS